MFAPPEPEIAPPAPVWSVPQLNVPPDHKSFPVVGSHAESPAPVMAVGFSTPMATPFENVEVPAPETVRRSATLNEVVDAIGNVLANVVEVAVKMDAVGPEVAAMAVLDVKYESMFVPPVPVMVPVPPLAEKQTPFTE